MFFKELRFFGGLRPRTPAGGYAPPTPSSEGVPSAGLAVLHMQTCGAWKENKVLALRRSFLRALPGAPVGGKTPESLLIRRIPRALKCLYTSNYDSTEQNQVHTLPRIHWDR